VIESDAEELLFALPIRRVLEKRAMEIVSKGKI
jgi:hypothetical protein